jgi:hypothetical protein
MTDKSQPMGTVQQSLFSHVFPNAVSFAAFIIHRNYFFMVKAAKRRSVSSVSVRSGRDTGKTKVVANS